MLIPQQTKPTRQRLRGQPGTAQLSRGWAVTAQQELASLSAGPVGSGAGGRCRARSHRGIHVPKAGHQKSAQGTELKGHSSCLPQLPRLVQANKTRTMEFERGEKRRKRQNCVPVNVLAVFKQTIACCRELKGEPRSSLPNLESLSVPKTSKFSNILDRNQFP